VNEENWLMRETIQEATRVAKRISLVGSNQERDDV
jgi:hypothetical protein